MSVRRSSTLQPGSYDTNFRKHVYGRYYTVIGTFDPYIHIILAKVFRKNRQIRGRYIK